MQDANPLERSKIDAAKAKIRQFMGEGKGFKLNEPGIEGFEVYVTAARELLAEEETKGALRHYLWSIVTMLDDEFFAWQALARELNQKIKTRTYWELPNPFDESETSERECPPRGNADKLKLYGELESKLPPVRRV